MEDRLDGVRSWCIIRDMPPLQNRISQMRALVEDWWKLEWECWRGQKAGWLATTDKRNWRMLRLYPALGAVRYGDDASHVFFKKPIVSPPSANCPTLETMVHRIREALTCR